MNGTANEIPVYHYLDAVPFGASPGILLIQHSLTTRSARREYAYALLAALAAHCYRLDTLHTAYESTPLAETAPCLAGIEHRPSISYAGNWIALACWPGRHVGIDLCPTEALPDQTTVASVYFSPEENESLQSTPLTQQALLFAQTWAILEARSKCHEYGLREWSADRQEQLNHCFATQLLSPPDHVLCLAWQ